MTERLSRGLVDPDLLHRQEGAGTLCLLALTQHLHAIIDSLLHRVTTNRIIISILIFVINIYANIYAVFTGGGRESVGACIGKSTRCIGTQKVRHLMIPTVALLYLYLRGILLETVYRCQLLY